MAKVLEIIKRNGTKVEFNKERIFVALEKAFLSENIVDVETIAKLTDQVVDLVNRTSSTSLTKVEFVQDIVEEVLMKNGHLRIAKNYILYREKQKIARLERTLAQIREHSLEVKVNDNDTVIFEPANLKEQLEQLAPDLSRVNLQTIIDSVQNNIYDKIPQHEIDQLILGAARERIELHYEYSYLASRIALNQLYKLLGHPMNSTANELSYREKFQEYVEKGISLEMLDPRLKEFDLGKLSVAIRPERDKLFMYLGTQIVMDRYLLRDRSDKRTIYELPQWFWMRVAMGLAVNETKKEERAIEFYNVLSKMDLVSSTPTLFNSGTTHSQMSSCYLNITDDSLDGIFKLYGDNAQLSKWAGGIGTDWTPVRATGSKIKGTNGASQGVVPFIKIFNDVALAVNQGGKRKGAMCAYMELWHADFEQFLELKKNTGDERRRTHDINTAAWIPDLFMKRVQENGKWTFFCPSDTPDLHDLYGKAFEARYEEYEKMELASKREVNALDLWRKMLTMLFETGHPWITFKDAANVRSPQDHVGVVHSSNLCTEITLNTSKTETAVCNLASLNLANMIKDGQLDREKIQRTVETGIRMLDNVIDNNYYPIPEAKNANLKHRAVGLGLMGYQDALYQINLSFNSPESTTFADRSMEMVSYHAILASSKLAKEKGTYESYKGSKWDRGIFPYDSLSVLEEERGRAISVDRSRELDWSEVYAHVKEYGMRNSNTMAIAPTATIANISGVFPCTEPAFKNIYMKENLSGNFVIINRYLIDDLESLGLWNKEILDQIKLNNGSISHIDAIPAAIREKYKEVFEIDAKVIIESAARRSKWIDQSASTNVFLNTQSGRVLSDVYTLAWEKGLKTTYYLRTLGASQVQKMTVAEKEAEPTPEPKKESVKAYEMVVEQQVLKLTSEPKICLLTDPTCEACQ